MTLKQTNNYINGAATDNLLTRTQMSRRTKQWYQQYETCAPGLDRASDNSVIRYSISFLVDLHRSYCFTKQLFMHTDLLIVRCGTKKKALQRFLSHTAVNIRHVETKI